MATAVQIKKHIRLGPLSRTSEKTYLFVIFLRKIPASWSGASSSVFSIFQSLIWHSDGAICGSITCLLGQQGWRLGNGAGYDLFGTDSRDHQNYTPPELMIPLFFCFTLFWFLRAPQPSISLLSCHRVDTKGLRCRLKDIWTGRTLERRNDKGGRRRRRRAQRYHHLVLQSRFGELESVTLVVHTLRSTIQRACPKQLPPSRSLSGLPVGLT